MSGNEQVPAQRQLSASTTIMQAEATAAQQKTLQAIIEAAAVVDPAITQRATVAAVWQYMRLPDSSFGWSGKADADGNRPPLPLEAKALCVLTTLSLGLLPGVGHILWLGNKVYITADARRFLANASPDFIKSGTPKYRPFSAEEKEMFAIDPADMALVLEQPIKLKGEALTAIGYGVIGADELDWRDKYGNRKAGMQSKKDAIMHLITRAERDMLNRTFPLRGISDAPDDRYEYERAQTIDVGAPRLSAVDAGNAVVEAERERADGANKRAAAMRLGDLAAQVSNAGGKATEVLGIEFTTAWVNAAALDELLAAGDVLEGWLAEHGPPPPESTGKKRGRKSNAEKAAAAAPPPATPAPVASAEPTYEPSDDAPPPEQDDDAFALDLDQARRDAEADVDAALGRPPDVRKGPTLAEIEAETRAVAAGRLRKALAGVEARGGLPMKILGFNPHNRLADPGAKAPELDSTSDLLEKWAPDKPSAVEKNVAAGTVAHVRKPPVDEAPHPADAPAPRQAPASAAPASRPTPTTAPHGKPPLPAYAMIEKALGMSDLNEGTFQRLLELKEKELHSNDHLYMPKAIREAKGGNFRELDSLLGGRKALG